MGDLMRISDPRMKSVLFSAIVLFGLVNTGPGTAQQIFDEGSRSFYRNSLANAIQALDRGEDVAALKHAERALSNMQAQYEKHLQSEARNKQVRPGYEVRLNSFVGNLDGFQKKFVPERADRDGQEMGAATTVIDFTPHRGNKNDFSTLVISVGVPKALVEMIHSNIRTRNHGTRTINGVVYAQMSPPGHIEQTYMQLIDDRILVMAVASRLDWAANALQVVDVNGLRGFSQ